MAIAMLRDVGVLRLNRCSASPAKKDNEHAAFDERGQGADKDTSPCTKPCVGRYNPSAKMLAHKTPERFATQARKTTTATSKVLVI